MALPNVTIAGLQFVPFAQSGTDYVCPIVIDLANNNSYSINPTGGIPNATRSSAPATGVVVDNMLGVSDLFVSVGPVTTMVPRYQKTAIPLLPNSPAVVFTGTNIKPTAYFYVGTFRGVTGDLNAYGSNTAANVASITGGTTDAYLNTLRWKTNYALPAGANLDNITDSGFYDVLNPVNSGTSLGNGTWAVECRVYSASNLYQYQRAYNLLSATIQVYERVNVQGTWSAWKPVTGVAASSYATNGYARFNDGLIIQWGRSTVPGGTGYVSFPFAFPKNAFSVTASVNYWDGSNAYCVSCDAPQTNQFGAHIYQIVPNGGAINEPALNIAWIATGN